MGLTAAAQGGPVSGVQARLGVRTPLVVVLIDHRRATSSRCRRFTHPVPDLTGYITERQVVLSAAAHARGAYPPVEPLSSLSRLMRHGAGPGRTRPDHLDVAAQLVAALARARQVRDLTDLIGAAALSDIDRRYLDFEETFVDRFVAQRPDERRGLDDSLDRAWWVLGVLPRRELTMLAVAQIAEHLGDDDA